MYGNLWVGFVDGIVWHKIILFQKVETGLRICGQDHPPTWGIGEGGWDENFFVRWELWTRSSSFRRWTGIENLWMGFVGWDGWDCPPRGGDLWESGLRIGIFIEVLCATFERNLNIFD